MLYLCINKNDKVMSLNYYIQTLDSTKSQQVTFEVYTKLFVSAFRRDRILSKVRHRFGVTLKLDCTTSFVHYLLSSYANY